MTSAALQTPTSLASEESIIQELGLERIFDERRLGFDLEQGTVRSATSERVLYLASDVLRGIYDALVEEAGPAWSIILKNCGKLWGRRLMSSFDAELKAAGMTTQAEATVGQFQQFVEAYFPLHGWGKLRLNLDYAAPHGVVLAELRHSLFVSLIESETQTVDPMIAGILSAFFSHVSGHDLDALELCCAAQGADACRFAITSGGRLEPLEERVAARESYETLLQSLLE